MRGKRNYRVIILILAAVIVLELMLISEVNLTGNQIKNLNKDSFNFIITLKSEDYSILKKDSLGTQQIIMKDFENINIPGEPALPSKIFSVLIPPGSKFISVEVIGKKIIPIKGNYVIKEAPTPQPISDLDYSKVPEIPAKQEIYESNSEYPPEIITPGDSGQMRKYRVQQIIFTPFSYKPLSGELDLIEEVTLRINYKKQEEISEEILNDQVMDEEAKELFVNYDQFKKNYVPDSNNLDLKRNTYDYLIITSQTLANSQAISDLVSYRQAGGFSVIVQDTSYIENNIAGENLLEKIRNYLIENYVDWNLKYVAFVGTIETIPMKYCDTSYPTQGPEYIPNDYYYQDLTGTWGDQELYLCGGEVDWYPEVYVGRIPIDNEEQLQDYVNRLIEFESSEDPYQNNVLLSTGTWYHANDAANTAEYIKNTVFDLNEYLNVRTYEETGTCPDTLTHDYDTSHSNILNLLTNNHYGIIYFASHGNPSRFCSKPCPQPDQGCQSLFERGDIATLDSNYPSIVFGHACSTSEPENPENLGYVLTQNFAVSYVGNTRLGWITDKSYKYYFDNLINKEYRNSKAMAMTQLSVPHWEALGYTLYSEPLLDLCHDLDLDGFCAKEDCDNNNGDVYPGRPEICNGIDDNCNGLIDSQELKEICGNGLDDDCDGEIDAPYDSDCDCSALSGYKCEKTGCSTGSPNNNYFCGSGYYCCRDCRVYFDKSCWCWKDTCGPTTGEELPTTQENIR